MAKRSYNVDKSERVDISDEEVSPSPSEEELKLEKETPETVRLVLLRDMKLNYTGSVTEKLYRFNGAGSILDVDKKDADIMLEKKGGDCCKGSGSNQPHPYFAIV